MTTPNTLPANGGVSDAEINAAIEAAEAANPSTEITRHAMRAALNVVAQSRPPSTQSAGVVEPVIPELFAKVGAAIASQDNRATDAPIFIVQQKRSYVTEDDRYECRYEWHETESGDYCGPADAEELERLETFYSNEGHEPKGWQRLAMMDVWEFVTACFTEQGCKDYLAINGHNLKEPRIYAEGSYRNEEFRSIRQALIDLAPPPAGGGKEALSDAERWKWLDENSTLSLKRIASYGQKWAEVRFPWVGNPFANRHETLTEAVDYAIRAGKKG